MTDREKTELLKMFERVERSVAIERFEPSEAV